MTLAQLFRMIFETAKISGIDIEGNTTDYWAYPYMLKAEELGLIEIENNLDEIKNMEIQRLTEDKQRNIFVRFFMIIVTR